MNYNRGFTLIEIVVVLAILAAMGGAITPLVVRIIDNKREKATIEALKEFKSAIIGDPKIVSKEIRTYFGYIGDMGSLPIQIEDLYQKGSQPSFTYDTTKKTGAGWNGPYIDPSLVENLASLKLDAYGNEFTYDATEFVDSTVGVAVSAKITSKGPDGVAGGDDDLSTYIYKTNAFSEVIGFVKDIEGNRVPGVETKINYPSIGTLIEATTTTDIDGLYQFADIPYGNRSVTVIPKLVYAAGSGITKGASFNDVEFKITNFAANAIDITSIKIIYTVTPEAFFKQVKIAGQIVYDSETLRGSSGDTITFSTITLAGTGAGVSGKSFPIRIQSPTTQVADINIGKGAGKGGTTLIEIKQFKDAISGGANPVDMTGVTFTIELSDGSNIVFAPERG